MSSSVLRHLSLLIDYMDRTFNPTSQRLETLLKHGEITYDLLWALFKPNTLVFTKCLSRLLRLIGRSADDPYGGV
jgi:hypothetical protein